MAEEILRKLELVLNKWEAVEKKLESFERFVNRIDVKMKELNGRINTLESIVKDNLSRLMTSTKGWPG